MIDNQINMYTVEMNSPLQPAHSEFPLSRLSKLSTASKHININFRAMQVVQSAVFQR